MNFFGWEIEYSKQYFRSPFTQFRINQVQSDREKSLYKSPNATEIDWDEAWSNDSLIELINEFIKDKYI